MKHVFRKLTVFLLVLAIVLSMLPAVFAAVGTLKPNSGTRDQLCTELSAKAKAYYTGSYSYENLAALGGATDTSTSYNAAQNNPLYTALNKLMTVTHTNQNVRYDGYAANSLATYWVQTDTENSASTYLFFYTDILASDPLVSGLQMQREHVWPKSRASYYQKGGGSDLHHLRPSIGGVNASKSNNAFANLNGTGSAYTVSGMSQPSIWTGSKDGVGGVLEVRDNVKGDVARILLYVYVRWQQPNLYSDVAANLLPEMDPDDSQNTGGRAIESLSTLLQWMQKDPVDTWEMSRNDQIENVQGNRNVFIDYPELAYLMFNWPIPTMTTPSGIAAGTAPTTPTEPTTAPTEPTTAPTTPTAAPTEPTTAPTEPTEATEPRGDEYALTTTVKDGDEIVIFNPASGKAMSEDAVSNVYRAGVSATVLNNNIYTDDSKIVWTVGKTADGYTFTNDKGETLSATTGLSFAATDNVWAINPAATANSVYLVSTSAVGTSGDPKYVEWYGRYNEFSTYYYSASLESDFALQLFVKTGNVAPEPTEPTTAPTEPTTAPTEPTTAPTEPTTAPTQPTTAPTEPTTAPTQPTTAPTEPTTAPTE
ncbi:MAG: endonuclease, partial [Oscillospiraceae bacterium]|nr:endonuclease [Oscillospiraceae bacterium]